MTNYINSIELNGDTYAVGPFSVDTSNNIIGWFNSTTSIQGSNNVIIGGTNSISGSNNVIIATPDANTVLSDNSNVVLATSSNSLCVAPSSISIGNAVRISHNTIVLGAMACTYNTEPITLTHSYPLARIDATIPCTIFLIGHVNCYYNENSYSQMYATASTHIYYSTAGARVVEGVKVGTIDGVSLYAYTPSIHTYFGFSASSDGFIYVGNSSVNYSVSGNYHNCVVDTYTVTEQNI